MRKLLLLLIALLTGVSGAWADVTVKIADGTNTNGPASYGDANSGRVDGSVTFKNSWTSNAYSGIPGLTLTASHAAFAEETAYSSYHCLGFKPSAGKATDVVTITAPTGYNIVGYTIKAGYWTSGETYTLTANDGTGTNEYTTDDSPKATVRISVTDINKSSTTLSIKSNQAANTKCLMINDFQVTLTPTGSAISVKYVVQDASGNEVDSKTVDTYTGTTPFVPSALLNEYCNYGSFYDNSSLTGDPVTTLTAATTLYTQLSVNASCPITFSTAETPVYYYLRLRDRYLYAAAADATYPSIQNEIKSTKEGAWAFIGNPYKFKIINKIVGKGKYLARNTSVSSGADNGTTFNTTGTDWQMNPHYLGGGFRIYDPSTSTPSHIYTNNTILMWLSWAGTSSDGNGGGRFVASSYSDDFTSQVTANIKPYFTKYAASGEVYFGITTATNTSYASTVTTRESSCTEDQYEELYGNVMAGIKYPTTGYYRLKNSSTSNYLGFESSLTGTLSSTAAASVAYLNSSSNGVFSILLQGDKYVQMPAGQDVEAATSSTPMNFTATIVAPGVVSLIGPSASNAFQNFGVSSSKIVGQQGSSATAQWILEDATSFSGTLTNAQDNTGATHSYATLCVPFAISALSGANAYMPTKDGDYIVPGNAATVSDGTLIAAGTPVLLIGANDAGTYTATIKTGSAPVSTPTTTNALTGTYTGTTIDTRAATGTNFVLGFDEDNSNRIGFYHVNEENFPLSANRAYLKLDGNGNPTHIKGFVINWDNETSINAIDNGQQTIDNAIYNLAGQKMVNAKLSNGKLPRGLYIVNGKKVIIK